MYNKDFFNNIYNDFFGIEKLKEENEKIAKELNLNKDYPEIELGKNKENTTQDLENIENDLPNKVIKEQQNLIKESENNQEDFSNSLEENQNEQYKEKIKPLEDDQEREKIKKVKDTNMANLFEAIEKLYISDESKKILKKAIEYMRKYEEGIEKEYIPFNLCIYSKDEKTMRNIAHIISVANECFNYVKKGEAVEVTLYNLEKEDQIEDIYASKNSIIILEDFEAICTKDQNFKDKFLHNLAGKIIDAQKDFLTIIYAKNKETITQAFDNNEDIKDNIFEFEITAIEPDIQDIYQEVKDKLKETNNLSDQFCIKLLDYISSTYPNTSKSYTEYEDKLIKEILFNKEEKLEEKDLPKYEKDKTMEETFAQLNELVGLKKIKKALQDLASLIELKDKTQGNLKIASTNLHMVFLGNPGTGKTTVARIVAQILYNLKYIKQNKLIEVSSKDLVAEYVGQTAPKTMAVIEKALGGVLFIDEAYTLASGQGQGNSYNEEAIATLIQAMENNRDNLVVIFAGYTKEMQNFLNANSGIVSRIGYTLEFDDYTEDELLQIFNSMMKKAGFIVTEDAEKAVREIVKEYKNTKNFGNARFMRNLYEKTVIKHATNTKGKKNRKALITIEKEDISTENLIKMEE